MKEQATRTSPHERPLRLTLGLTQLIHLKHGLTFQMPKLKKGRKK